VIKAIIFDFFGVIYSDEYWRFVKEDVNMQGQFHQLSEDVNLGRLDWQTFMQKVADKTGRPLAEVEKMYNSEHIHPLVVAFIDKLHKKYRTALLTNAHADFIRPLLERIAAKNVFDEIVISSEVGFIKPDPQIYQYTLQKLKAQPFETVFIDDTPVRVEGAKALGINAVLYKSFDQLKKDLSALIMTVSDN
jgi:epoxide hydrolase-like predicted phosphatase